MTTTTHQHLETEVLLEFFNVPKEFTVNEKQDVMIDYSCTCYTDDEGNIGHKNEVFAFIGFAGFTIDNNKAIDLVAHLRAAAERKYQNMFNISFN
jgi:dihydrodipicolinate reductase